MRLHFEHKITFGDLLTILIIAGSMGSAMYSWKQDRDLKRGEMAAHMRTAAATTITKLDRWRTLSLATFDNVRPAYVDIKELLRHNYDYTEARHTLWKDILKIEIDAKQQIVDEDIAAGYTDLSGYDAHAREYAVAMLKQLNERQEEAFKELLERTQSVLLELKALNPSKQCYNEQSDSLYNSLVYDVTNPIQSEYDKRITAIIQPADDALADVVMRSDKDLLKKSLVIQHKFNNPPSTPLSAEELHLNELKGSCLDTTIVKTSVLRQAKQEAERK
jgi:hypothetical protein